VSQIHFGSEAFISRVQRASQLMADHETPQQQRQPARQSPESVLQRVRKTIRARARGSHEPHAAAERTPIGGVLWVLEVGGRKLVGCGAADGRDVQCGESSVQWGHILFCACRSCAVFGCMSLRDHCLGSTQESDPLTVYECTKSMLVHNTGLRWRSALTRHRQ